MNDDLCMDLADCGSPEKLIAVILKHHPDWTPPVPIEQVARDVGITDFQELEVEGFEGALITDQHKSKGVILTKAGAPENRRRFTIAHELGHFLMPSHKGNRQCKPGDLNERRSDTEYRRQETEANRFAAGILMPRPWFKKDMDKLGDADVTHVQELSKRYAASLEATINRYVELTDDICAYVFSKDNVIRYVKRAKGFPKLAVKKDDPLPSQCASLKMPSDRLRVASEWTELNGSVWLETEWGKQPPLILEQAIRQQSGYQVTLLFIAARDDQDDEGDEEAEDRWTPRFARGR